jgi:hypothetical protein
MLCGIFSIGLGWARGETGDVHGNAFCGGEAGLLPNSVGEGVGRSVEAGDDVMTMRKTARLSHGYHIDKRE